MTSLAPLRRALLSVSDKSGLVDLARALDDIAEATPEKSARLTEMVEREETGQQSASRVAQDRWIGKT